jgi:8-oxo-dGTP pyrophosphatase MutT (NUDIX family)
MPELPRHSVSVTGIVIREDGRVLAIQRNDDGRWVPPGGVLELDESPAEGVAREILEETGMATVVITLTSPGYDPNPTGSASWCYVAECGDEYASARFDGGTSAG